MRRPLPREAMHMSAGAGAGQGRWRPPSGWQEKVLLAGAASWAGRITS